MLATIYAAWFLLTAAFAIISLFFLPLSMKVISLLLLWATVRQFGDD